MYDTAKMARYLYQSYCSLASTPYTFMPASKIDPTAKQPCYSAKIRGLVPEYEVHYLWIGPKTWSSYWFFLNRYFAFFANITVTVFEFYNLPPQRCKRFGMYRQLVLFIQQVIVCVVPIRAKKFYGHLWVSYWHSVHLQVSTYHGNVTAYSTGISDASRRRCVFCCYGPRKLVKHINLLSRWPIFAREPINFRKLHFCSDRHFFNSAYVPSWR
ncbi:hypothetical protein F5876DRAFT_61824 [Lentinula aff. lateritia]|uniref:Uncharacterized protein n=1 Tax=Lentinula aff. lateritia TaxID=2804960 RepID=A0ACC1UE46_9AGAR|nr:hypothetical protein F5876DRAFT_61824 [Lentinula aff. lateritia]